MLNFPHKSKFPKYGNEMRVQRKEINYSNKIFKFIFRCIKILIVVVAVGSIGMIYFLDQQFKIKHYNLMMTMCSKKPGAILKTTASTPVFGSGVEMSCEYINPHDYRRHQ